MQRLAERRSARSFAAAEDDEGGAVPVDFGGADATDVEKLVEGLGSGEDEGGENGIVENEKGGLAGGGGFGFAPGAETLFEGGLGGREGWGLLGGWGRGRAGGIGGAGGFRFPRLAEGAGVGVGGLGEQDVEGVVVGEGSAFIGERRFAEGDFAAFGIGESLGSEGDEAGAGEAVEECVKGAAGCGEAGAAADVGEEAAGGFGAGGEQLAEDAAEVAFLLRGGLGVRLGGGALR